MPSRSGGDVETPIRPINQVSDPTRTAEPSLRNHRPPPWCPRPRDDTHIPCREDELTEGSSRTNRSILPPASGALMPGDPLGDRRITRLQPDRRFALEAGGALAELNVAYETWGELDPDASNAVLICHALTGDSHAAGRRGPGHPAPGWWEGLIGPGRAIDTDRYFVVCSNVLGGCQGTTGPASTDPATGRPYGSTFPQVTIRDMVRAQILLADHLGVYTWASVIGGSMGGMQALEWSVMAPDRVRSVVVASSTTAASAQQIAWSHIGRSMIRCDAGFLGGDYYDLAPGEGPHRGLELARQVAQVTYRSNEVYSERFGREPIAEMSFGQDEVFTVEGYLEYHGRKLVHRFDANSYLHLNRAMDFHDLARGRGTMHDALRRITAPVLNVSVRSDSLYPPSQQHDLHDGVLEVGGRSTFIDLDSPHGHDGFLIETAKLGPSVRKFLEENT